MAGSMPSSGLSMESTDIALLRSLVPGGEDGKVVVQQDIFQVTSICGKCSERRVQGAFYSLGEALAEVSGVVDLGG